MGDYGIFQQIVCLREYRSKRSSSWDRTGGNADNVTIKPGETHSLLEEGGAGCVKHIYWTYIRSNNLREDAARLNIFRGLVLRMFWDGASRPSVEVPLGDFFGIANGQVRPIRSLAFVVNPGFGMDTGRSFGFNCYFPMPFSRGAHVEIENQGSSEAVIWYHVDYELHGTSAPAGRHGRFHALWHREHPTEAVPAAEGEKEIKNLTGEDNYVILDIRGSGQFAGYFLTVVNSSRDWWGEGDDMVFIDGEAFPPSIHGTGTEEIFGGGAGPDTEYSGPYTGFHCVENRAGYRWWGTNGMYRFYVQDPLRFSRSIRVTLEHGHGNDMANDYSSVAFWYQEGVNTDLPPLAGLQRREINI
jgi:hypothetical protein